MNIKIVHKVIRPSVKAFERLPMETKILLLKILDSILISRTAAEKNRIRALNKNRVTPVFELNRVSGLSKFTVQSDFTESAIQFARKTLASHLQGGEVRSNSKDYLRQIFNSGMLGDDSRFLFEWATSDQVLQPISDYFQKFPLLHEISVFYSPPTMQTTEDYRGSQLFHMDGGGTQCVKLWLLCDDVALENGPTVLLPANFSQELAKKLSYEPGTKISDSTVNAPKEELFTAIGPAGTWFATDTDRCLHYGSRTGVSSGRLVLMFHFVDHNSTYYLPVLSRNYMVSTKKLSKKFVGEFSKFAKLSVRLRTI
jgi:hypothetical protein